MFAKVNEKVTNLYQIIFLIIYVIPFTRTDSCHDDPVLLDGEFLNCCRGCPRYTSELCIDSLLENMKFSKECLVDCMYKEFQIYNGETLDLATVQTILDSKITNGEFKLVYTKAFERCSRLDKLSINKVFSFLNVTNKHACDEYPSNMDTCVWYYTLANCPPTYANNDEACLQKRHWVKECLLEE